MEAGHVFTDHLADAVDNVRSVLEVSAHVEDADRVDVRVEEC